MRKRWRNRKMDLRVLHLRKFSIVAEMYDVQESEATIERGYISVSLVAPGAFSFPYFISFIFRLSLIRRLSPSQQISSENDSTVESSSLSLSSLSACGPSTRHESWTCALCTYLNQTKSSRCAQCANKRDAIAEPSSHATNLVQEQIDALSIRDATDPEVNAATVNRTSPLGSSNLSGSRTNLGAVGEQQNKNQPALTKWCCVVMTKLTLCERVEMDVVNNVDIFCLLSIVRRLARSWTGQKVCDVRCVDAQRNL